MLCINTRVWVLTNGERATVRDVLGGDVLVQYDSGRHDVVARFAVRALRGGAG